MHNYLFKIGYESKVYQQPISQQKRKKNQTNMVFILPTQKIYSINLNFLNLVNEPLNFYFFVYGRLL